MSECLSYFCCYSVLECFSYFRRQRAGVCILFLLPACRSACLDGRVLRPQGIRTQPHLQGNRHQINMLLALQHYLCVNFRFTDKSINIHNTFELGQKNYVLWRKEIVLSVKMGLVIIWQKTANFSLKVQVTESFL